MLAYWLDRNLKSHNVYSKYSKIVRFQFFYAICNKLRALVHNMTIYIFCFEQNCNTCQATIQQAWKLILWSKSFGQYLKCTDAIPLKVKLKYKLGAEHNTYCISWNIFILVLITNDKTTDKSCNPVNPQQFYSHLKHFLSTTFCWTTLVFWVFYLTNQFRNYWKCFCGMSSLTSQSEK